MSVQKASQEEIDFVFNAIDWKFEGLPQDYDGSSEFEMGPTELLDLFWRDHHRAAEIGVQLKDIYIDGVPQYNLVPDRMMGTYRISKNGERSFEQWISD